MAKVTVSVSNMSKRDQCLVR